MPRTSIQCPPKLRKHRPTGRAVVTLNGQHHYLGKHGSAASRKEYDRLITLWVQNGGRLLDSQEVTVADVMLSYLKFAKTYYRKDGKVTSEYHLVVEACRAVRPIFGNALARDFGPLALKTVRQTMVDAGHSRRTINKQTDRIRRMFKWSAAEEQISAEIPQALSMVAGLRQGRTEAKELPPVRPVGEDVVDATLCHLPTIPGDMVRFQRLTGCRPQDVCNLRPCDLDRTGDVWTYRPESHKTQHHGKTRIIAVGPQAQSVLLRYLTRDSKAHCFQPCDSEAKRRATATRARKTPLSCGNKVGSNTKQHPKRIIGKRYSTDSYRQCIQRAASKAGVERWSPNQLRHSAATEVRQRYGLEAAQTFLGHSQASVTEIYAERDLALSTRVAREIG